MPDLLTHVGIGALVRARADHRPLLWFLVGSALPDLASRLPSLSLVTLSMALDWPVSLPVLEGLNVCHTPMPYLLLCLLAALFVPERHRAVAWVNLSAAGLLHLALDATQRHLEGGYMLLFPLSTHKWELGWIDAELSLRTLPWLAAVVAVVYGVRWWRARRTSRGPDQRSK